jgi:DMSO/TMAO reductase YedYZ molybdopterin-dependent catalytic subunit
LIVVIAVGIAIYLVSTRNLFSTANNSQPDAVSQATVLWEGVRITDLLAEAGINDEANTVIFHCVDGYTTALPLATVQDKAMLLAYSANGVVLPASMGFPFIVVAEDKLGYKWARWATEIELSSDENYKGYWERRGYENDATVNK